MVPLITPLKKIYRIIDKVLLIPSLVILVLLIFLNGPIWLWFCFIGWTLFVSILWIRYLRYLAKKKSEPRKKINESVYSFSIVFLIFAPIILSSLSFSFLMIPVSYIRAEFNHDELAKIVDELTANCTTDEEKTIAILNWFDRYSGNIYNIWSHPSFGPFRVGEEYPNNFIMCTRTLDRKPALWVLTSRCGACEEHSVLFQEMANQAGLPVRLVLGRGIDHIWAEVKINGTWIIVDPANVIHRRNVTGYNLSAESYERHAKLTQNISYVFAEYIDGTREDITYRYTNLTHVNITTVDENLNPVPDVEIEVFSYNRANGGINTELKFETNKNGEYKLNMGGGDVKFASKTKDIIPLYNETRMTFIDGEYQNVTIILKSDFTKGYLLPIIALTCVIVVIVAILISKTRTNDKKRGQKND